MLNNKERHKLYAQIGDAENRIKYSRNLSEEEKAREEMRIASAQRRLNMDSNGADIFSNKYSNVQSSGADIFTPEPNTISKEAEKELFGGTDFNVQNPDRDGQHFIYWANKK